MIHHLSQRWNGKKKKKQKRSKSQVIVSPSLSEEEMREAMKKQNDAALSLTPALTMMAAGNGSCSDELKAVYSEIATIVFADVSASGGPKISAINGVWVEQSLPVNHSFKDLLKNVFKATFDQVDFRSKAQQMRIKLNKWASDHTNGLIRDLLPPESVTSATEWICGNALYFKGAWKNKFSKSNTKYKDFHLINGSSVSVPFMSSKKDQYIEAYDGFKVLGLPYRQGRSDDDTSRKFSMYFYLPDKKDGLNNLVEEMTSTPGFLDSHIPKYKVQVGDFRIPKFKISFMFEASRIFEEPPPPKRIDFVADHPFLFLIREDNTVTVLFAGQIFDPSS
ncbi:hypothetical protein EUTSA_v10024058mg [Eutrema salsugineum]|uniref:Serpin domain-containing protein n=1 Tax=Eutrema salsugineum TaxID=72664 RepID=V4KGK6_EUTSA|nr:hypothetical protein EUTSA_v10024058mg [Eutrema salsugineum]